MVEKKEKEVKKVVKKPIDVIPQTNMPGYAGIVIEGKEDKK